MQWGEAFRMAWLSMWNNKLRTFLTLLGIAIGIGSTIALLGMGVGFKAEILKEFEAIGKNTIMIFPNIFQETGKKLEPLTEKDRRAVEAVCGDDIAEIIPFIFYGRAAVKYQNKTTAPQVTGTTDGFPEVQRVLLDDGRFLSKADVAAGRRVAVLDWRVVEKLFGNINPVGKTVNIDGRSFQVIGTLQKQSSSVSLGTSSNGRNIYIPVTTLQRIMGFWDYYGFYIIVNDLKRTDAVTEQLKSLMVKRYGKDHNVQIFNTQQLLQSILVTVTIITVLLGVIGGIALTVAGIGIMNIMLVTVTERIREIGIRKAIGAKNGSILWQFLTEAVFICIIGGTVGTGLGFVACSIMGRATPLQPVITPALVITAFLFAAAVGLFFGAFPAWRAAKLDPIEALRHD